MGPGFGIDISARGPSGVAYEAAVESDTHGMFFTQLPGEDYKHPPNLRPDASRIGPVGPLSALKVSPGKAWCILPRFDPHRTVCDHHAEVTPSRSFRRNIFSPALSRYTGHVHSCSKCILTHAIIFDRVL
jgi:hypothetical protein